MTNNKFKSVTTLLLLLFVFTDFSLAQKTNPDVYNIPVKNKVDVIYKSSNSSEDLKSVKAVEDSRGHYHVLFCDGNLGTAYLATNQSGSWQTEVISNNEPISGDVIQYVAMDIDKNDGLHVILVGYPGTMYYGYQSSLNGAWKFTEVSHDKMPQLHNFYIFENYIDLAVDNSKGVHVIAKTDLSGRGHSSIYFYKSAGGDWSSEIIREGVNDTGNDYGQEPSIRIKDGKVMVTFGGAKTLNLAEKSIGGGQWKIDELINDSDNSENYKKNTCLAFTPEGKPVISFFDYKSSDLRGVNVLTQNECNGEWMRSSVGDAGTSGSAVAVDKDGVVFLAYCNDGGFTKVAYRKCTIDRSWKDVIKLDDLGKIFIDMFVDKNNDVNVFYSTYEDEIKHIKLWFEGKPDIDNNILPYITNKPNTNVKIGEQWTGTITAVDPECDNIEYYFVANYDGFTLNDNGNGKATITARTFDRETEYPFVIFLTDQNHESGRKPLSGAEITLKITKDGKSQGKIKYIFDEGDLSKKKEFKLGASNIISQSVSTPSGASLSNDSGTQASAADNQASLSATGKVSAASADCEDYLKRYSEWVDKFIVVAKKVKSNPFDFGSATKMANMSAEMGNWAQEWQQKYVCAEDEDFVTKYEAISDKLEEAMQ